MYSLGELTHLIMETKKTQTGWRGSWRTKQASIRAHSKSKCFITKEDNSVILTPGQKAQDHKRFPVLAPEFKVQTLTARENTNNRQLAEEQRSQTLPSPCLGYQLAGWTRPQRGLVFPQSINIVTLTNAKAPESLFSRRKGSAEALELSNPQHNQVNSRHSPQWLITGWLPALRSAFPVHFLWCAV